MSDSSPKLWQTRSVTFLLAAFAAASVGFWVLQWPQPSHPPRALALDAAFVTTDAAKVATLLGAAPQAASQPPGVLANVSSRFKLWGIIAQSQPGHLGASGSALIAVDGAPAKPYRVGQQVVDDLTLHSVQAHSVMLGPKGQSAASVTLELPAPPGVIAPKPAK